jgi:Icc-related predicted phosphoesterase
MKILALGDPHGSLKNIKKIPLKNVEIILITGDIGKSDLRRKLEFNKLKRKENGLKEIKYSPEKSKKAFMETHNSTLKILKYLSKSLNVFFVYGNIDGSDERTKRYSKYWKTKVPFLSEELKNMKNVKVIDNKTIGFKGIKITGISQFTEDSWFKRFRPKDKGLKDKSIHDTDKIKKIFRKLKKVDILISHSPPYGILDKVNFSEAPKNWQGKHAGSKLLLAHIKKTKPKLVLCGHIHEAKGEAKIGKTKVINLGCCGDYKIIEV